jgi:hypothetical protein
VADDMQSIRRLRYLCGKPRGQHSVRVPDAAGRRYIRAQDSSAMPQIRGDAVPGLRGERRAVQQ